MSGKAKKGQGGSEDPDKKADIKKPSAGPPKKSSTEQSKKQDVGGPPSQVVARPSTPVSTPSSMPLPGKGEGPARVSDTSPSKLPDFKFPPDSAAAMRSLVQFSTMPIPPRSTGSPPKPSYDKGPSGKYKMNVVEGLEGSFSDRSAESSGELSLPITAFSEPLMEHETRREEDGIFDVHKGEKTRRVTLTRGGRYYLSRVLVDDLPVQGQQWTAFMLHPGQGGTFGFGRVFLNEHRQPVIINDSEARAKKGSSIVKHLLFYGKGVGMIGTSKCVSCVGVYFELTGNRLFCAHINALHHAGLQNQPDMVPHSPDHVQMKEMIRRRMEGVSKRDGWSSVDYMQGTLKLVCPNRIIAGFAVVEAINEFLGTSEQVIDSPGFVFTPGFTTAPYGPQGGILLKVGTEGTKRLYQRVPREISQVFCDDSHGRNVIQSWTYISGSGTPNGWLWINYGEHRLSRYYSNKALKDKECPGLLSAPK